jgi:hypothetical protein
LVFYYHNKKYIFEIVLRKTRFTHIYDKVFWSTIMYIANYLKPTAHLSLQYTKRTTGVIVKNNTETGQDNLLGVYIPRLMFGLPIKNGAYEKTVSINTSKILNSKNKTIGKTSLKVKNYVELIVTMNNNIIPPKFVNGEDVIVDFADEDIKSAYVLPYSFGVGEINRRKTDILTMYVNNFQNEGEIPDVDNIYAIQLDTKNQMVSIFTSQRNGEKGVYTFSLNGKEGKVLISDSGKRTIIIKTDDDSITVQNEAKSLFSMVSDVMTMKANILNITMDSEINIKTSKMRRVADTIETTATEDKEHIKTLKLDGNQYNLTYNNQTLKGSLHQNTTSIFKVTCPISGFSGILTAKAICIFPIPGVMPPPTNATMSSNGVATFGTPNSGSLPLAVAPYTITALASIASTVDSLGSAHGIPANLANLVSSLSSKITSRAVRG